MEKAAKFLNEMQVPFEMNALSAHRTPREVEEFARTASERGLKVIIAGAVSIVGLIWFKAQPESFKNMKNEFSFLTFKTSFKKQEKIFPDEK